MIWPVCHWEGGESFLLDLWTWENGPRGIGAHVKSPYCESAVCS